VKEKVMKKMKSLLLVLGMIIIAGSNVRAEKKILKNIKVQAITRWI